MDVTRLQVLEIRQVKPKDFIQFWERSYSGYDEKFYRENIDKPLDEDRLVKWFAWKNGKRLSEKKRQSVRRYLSPKERIIRDADSDTLEEYLNRPGGAIWRIFWLHIQHHNRFPIYDQHVHRAMAFLLNWPVDALEIPGQNAAKVRMHLDHYRPFVSCFSDCEHRKVDRALWSFGRFLSTGYGREIFALPKPDSSE
jgi:hypothetical protein